jgi:hypothetical protein
MKLVYLASIFFIVVLAQSNVDSAEIALETQKMECRNCLAKFENSILSILHSFDNEKMQQLKKLQALGYMQGSNDLTAQLVIPSAFAGPDALVRVTLSSLTGSHGGQQYIIIALADKGNREIAKEQIMPEKYEDAVKKKYPLIARLKTLGRNRGAIVLKFAGIKHVRISRIEIE